MFCSVLSEDATQTQTFEGLASTLHHYFSKQDYFKVGNALVSHSHRLHTIVDRNLLLTLNYISAGNICFVWFVSQQDHILMIVLHHCKFLQHITRVHLLLHVKSSLSIHFVIFCLSEKSTV